MPSRVVAIKYEFEPVNGTIFTTVTGSVTADEIIKYLGEVLRHPDRGHPHREIFDLRMADLVPVDMDGARRIADFAAVNRTALDSGMVAVVAPRDVEFGMGRVIGAYMDELPFQFRVFRNMEDARHWIGLA